MDPALAIEVAASSRVEAVNLAISRGDSDIQRFYKDSVIFLTGGSGFLGKQLTEKLLRSCSVSKIYLLIRPKKGKSIQQRMDELFNEPVFDSLRKMQPNFTSSIVPVAGDVSELNLGIKEDFWKILTEEVNVIFHVAATTKFDETIQVATLINVRGTREVLALGKASKNLKSFVHVSTAFTHATTLTINKKVFEQFFTSPIAPKTLIQMVECMEHDRLRGITPALIKDWPNSYTFTKAVAEELIRESSTGLPICIVRPGAGDNKFIQRAFPGWIDASCLYGATGYLYGFALGVLHTVQVSSKAVPGYIPCDMVNNAVIAAGKEAATSQVRGGNCTKIYNVTTTNRNLMTLKKFRNFLEDARSKIPSPSSVYYVFGHITEYMLVYMILSLFLHVIPAYIADAICLLQGKKPRFAKLSKKLFKMLNVLSFFFKYQWTFVDTNLENLFKSLSKEDKIIFNFDILSIDIDELVKIWCVGIRKYIIKDGLQGTNYSIKKQKVLRIVNYIVMTIYMYGLWKLFYFICYSLSLSCTYIASILTSFDN